VPDRVRAFSLGLADSVMVLAAMLGALIAPRLARLIGGPTLFVVTGLIVIAVGISRSRSRVEVLSVQQEGPPAGESPFTLGKGESKNESVGEPN